MKYFVDGDQLVIVLDDFVNLQESPAMFYPLSSDIAKVILEAGSVMALPLDALRHLAGRLQAQCVIHPQEVQEVEVTDKEWLLDLANGLDTGEGFFEEPEGTHWIQISDERVREIVSRLRNIAEKVE